MQVRLDLFLPRRQSILPPSLISSTRHWRTHANASGLQFAPKIHILPNEPPQTQHIQVARPLLAIARPSSPSWWSMSVAGGRGGGEEYPALFCDKLTNLGWLTLSVLKYLQGDVTDILNL
jgi:hypothetical protein